MLFEYSYLMTILVFDIFIESFYPVSGDRTDNVRIVGGYQVNISVVPYIVLITIKSNSKGVCTGSIVAKEWVLTAAHCFYLARLQDVKIIAGTSSETDYRSPRAQVRSALSIVKHPEYSDTKILNNDFALVKVNSFKLSAVVGILELGGEEWPQDQRTYARKCVAVGWGLTADNDREGAGSSLLVIDVIAEHGERACTNCFGRLHKKLAVCLKRDYKGLCYGDSGGPLVCNGKGYGVAHIIFDSKKCERPMWNDGVPKCENADSISTYSYICPVLDWIHKFAFNQPKRPTSCRGSDLNAFSTGLIVSVLVTFCKY